MYGFLKRTFKSEKGNNYGDQESSWTETKRERQGTYETKEPQLQDISTRSVAHTAAAQSISSSSARSATKFVALTAKLKALYRAQNTLPKLIEGDSIPDQRMDDYYVNLQILLNDDNSGGKQQIDVSQIFDKVGDLEAAKKVLITGGAGIGKTTLLHNISYQWGKKNIFADKFDYVFKVKLKKLLFDIVKSQLVDLGAEDILPKLIDMSIKDQQFELTDKGKKSPGEFTVEEIKQALNGKALLLLDGYDEIAYLDRRDDAGSVVYRVMRSIDKCSIIVTSRPNAVSPEKQREFALKIETIGLGQEEASSYIHKYFTNQQKVLLKAVDEFYTKHSKIPSDNIMDLMKGFLKNHQQKYETIEEIIKTENPALEQQSIKSSIVTHYQAMKDALTNLLFSNLNLKEVATIPINLVMLCSITSDQKSMSQFNGDFNAGTLYQEAIVWLGKRYGKKYIKDFQIDGWKAENIFKLEALSVLREVAYNKFIQEKDYTNIEGSIIDKFSTQYIAAGSIRKVYEFGLLRAEDIVIQRDQGEFVDKAVYECLTKVNHTFIHLSFQEYLTAHLLKDHLMSKEQQTVIDTAKFIANHRNEPRYLMTLKFLSGMVSNHKYNSANGEEDQAQLLVTRFWEAVTCNVDGVLELSIETKLTLFMHLLNQSKVKGITDHRIPNLDKIKKLIDEIVLKDITKWGQQIIDSGYLSENIAENVKLVLATAVEAISLKEILPSELTAEIIGIIGEYRSSLNLVVATSKELSSSNFAGKKPNFLNKDLKSYGARDQAIIENAFNQKDNPNYYYKATDITLIQGQVMKKYSDYVVIHEPIGNTLEVQPIISELIRALNNDKPVLCIYNFDDSHWITFAALKKEDNTIVVLYKDSYGRYDSSFEKQIHEIAATAQIIVHRGREQTQGLECGIFAIENMHIIAEELLKDNEGFIKGFASFEGFCALTEAKKLREGAFAKEFVLGKEQEMNEEFFKASKLMQLRSQHQTELALISTALKEGNQEFFGKYNIKSFDNKHANDVSAIYLDIATSPETNPASDDYVYYYRIALSKDIEANKEEIARNINKAFSINTEGNIESLEFNQELAMLINEKEINTLHKNPKKAVNGEAALSKIRIEDLIDNLYLGHNSRLKEEVELIVNLEGLKDTLPNEFSKEIKDKDLNLAVPLRADSTQLKIATEIITSLINKREFGGKEIIFKQFISLLYSEDWEIQKLALNSLSKIINITIDHNLLQECSTLIIQFIRNDYLINYTINVLAKIGGIIPNVASVALENLSSILSEKGGEYYLQETAAKALPEIAKAIPSCSVKVIEVLIEVLVRNDYTDKVSNNLKEIVKDSLLKVVRVMPLAEAFETMKFILDNNICYDLRKAVTKVLLEIIKVMPSSEAFNIMENILISKRASCELKVAIAQALPVIVEAMPSIAAKAFEIIKIILNDKVNWGDSIYGNFLPEAAIMILPAIVEARSFLAEEAFETIKRKLSYKKLGFTKSNIIMVLPAIVKAKPSIAVKAFKTIKSILNDGGDSNCTYAATIQASFDIFNFLPVVEALKIIRSILDGKEVTWKVNLVTQVAMQTLTKIVKDQPSTAIEAFEVIMDMLENRETHWDNRELTTNALAEIIKALSSEKSFKPIKNILNNKKASCYLKKSIIEALPKVITALPQREVFDAIMSRLSDKKESSELKAVSIEALHQIVQALSWTVREAFEAIKFILNDKETSLELMAVAIKALPPIV